MKTKLAYHSVVMFGMMGALYGSLHLSSPRKQLKRSTTNVKQPSEKVLRPEALPQPAKKTSDPTRRVIKAKGVVRPEELVEVGAQVTGIIEEFGQDPKNPDKLIDNGSVVHKGTVLAKIAPAIYQARVDYAKASLAIAEANLLQFRAKCDRMKNEWLRAKGLLPEKAISLTEYDLLESNYKAAQANVTIGKASIEQNEAQLRIAQTNLDHTIIKSPIDGVIVDRRVSIGQTVMAAFNVPGLFVIAKDLRQVKVWASVKETDIGYIRPGQPAEFTVDAYPGEQFEGKVAEILLSPKKNSDCMTYTVVVVPECCRTLLPYLSVQLQFIVDRPDKV